MEHARKQQLPKETITSSGTATLKEFDKKNNLLNTMTKSKSFNKSLKHIYLYHALMESILDDEDDMDKDQVVKPIFVQDFDNVKHNDVKIDYADVPIDQGEYLGNTDEQRNNEAILKNDWYKKSSSDTSLDPE
nr:hypothetical protein [Tanacetum cinerariifolium]